MVRGEKIGKRLLCLLVVLAFLFCIAILILDRENLLEIWTDITKQTGEPYCVVEEETVWAYVDGGEVPKSGAVWTAGGYDVSGWKKGQGIFAAENAGEKADTQLNSRNEKGETAVSYFFRTEFTVETMEELTALQGCVRYRDAILIYLNGEVIFAGNVPANGYHANQEAGAVGEGQKIQENDFWVTDLSALRKGKNVLAVEIHQKDSLTRDAFMEFPYLWLVGTEVDETAPDMDGLYLEQGSEKELLTVRWITDAEGFYLLEYAEKAAVRNQEDYEHFSELAECCFMGREEYEGEGKYLHTVPLETLKSGTTYLYRIRRVGSQEASELGSFETGGKKKLSVALPMQGGSPAEGVNFSVLRQTAEDGEATFYRGNPVCVQKEEDYVITYLDSLLFVINADAASWEEHASYIRCVTEEKQRKWVVVVVQGEVEWELIGSLGIDLLFCPAGTDGGEQRSGVVSLAEECSYQVTIEKDMLRVETYTGTGQEKKEIYCISK